jgi:GNAT superfamily N-acetyltransferase
MPGLRRVWRFGARQWRGGRGYGTRLFERAVMHARNEGVDLLFIHALSENTAMLKIARNSGARWSATAQRPRPGCAFRPATWTAAMSELVDERVAETDYRSRVQAKQFWEFLAMIQEIRAGVRNARDRASP